MTFPQGHVSPAARVLSVSGATHMSAPSCSPGDFKVAWWDWPHASSHEIWVQILAPAFSLSWDTFPFGPLLALQSEMVGEMRWNDKHRAPGMGSEFPLQIGA